MRPRTELRAILKEICPNIYFQPPETIKMVYPCIVYELSKIDPRFADNKPYSLNNRYTLIFISKDPDDPIKFEIAKLQGCRFDRSYKADNLYHYSYSIYY